MAESVTKEVTAAAITAIGAFSSATLGFFDLSAKRYRDDLGLAP